MKYFFSRFYFIFVVSLLIFLFRSWFFNQEIIGGDWPYFFPETLSGFAFFPPSWSVLHGNGLGGQIIAYNLDQYLYLTAQLTNVFHIAWPVVYKIFWFWFFIALSAFSITFLLRTVLVEKQNWMVMLGILLFTANTYILMLVGGGQMGVALAYAMAPLVLAKFIKLIDVIGLKSRNFQFSIFNFQLAIVGGLVLAVQVMFDPRIAYITMIAVIGYFLLHIKNIKSTTFFFLVIGIAGLLNSYWILPIFLTKSTGIPQGFFDPESLQFFSFADFSHALSLLHPNWPENIFGKTYFLRPEFLVPPLFAYISVFFSKKSKNLSFFTLLGLLGVFLAKGANPPFGEVNIWIYNHIPGMYVFRDPTKFYLLTAISYSVLIPFSLSQIYNNLNAKLKMQNSKIKQYLPNVFLLLAMFYLLFLIRPALLGELNGTFTRHAVPDEYVYMKDLLTSQNNFFRTLWIPKQQRFTYVSDTHPAIEAQPLFSKENIYAPFYATNSAELVKQFKENDVEKYIKELSVKYIIIPYDSLGEIFLQDRKYNEKERTDFEKELDFISWLKKIHKGRLTVYEAPSFNDHFLLTSPGDLSYTAKSSTDYNVLINTKSSNTLIFSENYNPYWIAKIGDKELSPIPTDKGFISFAIPQGSYMLDVYYSAEKYYIWGRIVSGTTLFLLLSFLIMLKSKDYEEKRL